MARNRQVSIYVALRSYEELGIQVGDRIVIGAGNVVMPYAVVRPITAREARRAARAVGVLRQGPPVPHVNADGQDSEPPDRSFPADAMRIFPEGPRRALDEAVTWGRKDKGLHVSAVLRVERDIRGTTMRAGDIVILPFGRVRPGAADVRHLFRGFVEQVPRSQFQAIADNLDALSFIASSYRDESDPKWSKDLRAYVSHRSARKGSDSTSRLLVVRPFREITTAPITASSDDAALFELLAQVGGKMPV